MTPTSKTKFTFRTYQCDDIPRAAMHDGAIIGWDPGMGKTMAMFSLPYLKRSKRTLIVAPAGLHKQIIKEGKEKFHVPVTTIRNQADFLDLLRRGDLPFGDHTQDTWPEDMENHPMPEFFITDYKWLGQNGADEQENPNDLLAFSRRCPLIAEFFDLSTDHILASPKALADQKYCHNLGVSFNSPREKILEAFREQVLLTAPLLHPESKKAPVYLDILKESLCKILDLDRLAVKERVDEIMDEARKFRAPLYEREKNIGVIHRLEDDTPIRCLRMPSLSTLAQLTFDCVICDEATRLKSGTALMAQGVIRLAPKSRYLLTGTPVKNKLPDIFWLVWWVAGSHREGCARFPFEGTASAYNEFCNEFLVQEENLTQTMKSRQNGKFRRYVKRSNEVTNVHRLWKILGPLVIRRRKDDSGAKLVKKTIIPVHALPGKRQIETYQHHLEHPEPKATPTATLGAQLQTLRMVALSPAGERVPSPRSDIDFTPKIAGILQLAPELIEKGEQLVVFSPFQSFSRTLSAYLKRAKVDHALLDGNTSPAKRGESAQLFKERAYPVLIAGIASMAEGHSFENASNLVLPSLSWAYDENAQAIERVHRLTSKKEVSIYVMVTKNTIDQRLASVFEEKGDSSDLALDGRLFETDKEEMDLAAFMQATVKDFDPTAQSISETDCLATYRAELEPRLITAGESWRNDPANQPKPQPKTHATTEAPTTKATPIPTPPPAANPQPEISGTTKPKPTTTKETPQPTTPPTAKPQPAIDKPQAKPQPQPFNFITMLEDTKPKPKPADKEPAPQPENIIAFPGLKFLDETARPRRKPRPSSESNSNHGTPAKGKPQLLPTR